MNIRIGLDLVSVESIQRSLAGLGDRYMTRVYTDGEIADCHRPPAGPDPARLARRFAAKEAVLKVLPATDIGLSFRDIEVVHDAGGRERIALHGRAAELAAASGVTSLSVSLSGDADHALAVVVAELASAPDDDGVTDEQSPTR